MIISAVCEKGGPGKTTVVTNLAVEFTNMGMKTLVVDLDPQRSSILWGQTRERANEEAGEGERLVEVPTLYLEGSSITTALPRIAQDYDVVLVDTPGRDDAHMRSALTLSDLTLVVFAVGGVDYAHLNHTLDVVRQAQRVRMVHEPERERLQARVVMNKTRRRSIATRQMRGQVKDTVAQIHDIELCAQELRELDDFGYAYMYGMAAREWEPRGNAAKDIRDLARELDATFDASVAQSA